MRSALALLLAAVALPALADQGVLQLRLMTPTDEPVEALQLRAGGDTSTPSDEFGDLEIDVPGMAPGERVALSVGDPSWVLVTREAVIPDWGDRDPVRVVVLTRASFQALALGALGQVAERQRSGQEVAAEQRRAIIAEYAQERGLSAEQLGEAAASFKESSDDSFDRVLAERLEGHIDLAGDLFEESLAQRLGSRQGHGRP